VASFTESLQELESAVIRIDQRLADIKTDLASINRKTVDRDDITAALSSFGPVWDELYPVEKTRIVNLLIERVEYRSTTGNLYISFRCSI
jgi:hypothetical protein